MAKPIGVYLHIPFCRKRCAYCDFYSAIVNNDMVSKYVEKLKSEIYRWGGQLGRPADTVYFGGGTPSVLSAEQLTQLLGCVKEAFGICHNSEITIEINPENAQSDYLLKLKKAGFNRLSIGVQSLNDTVLKTLGRRHNAEDAINAFNTARQAGFDNISVDLMLGLVGQSSTESEKIAKEIIKLSPEHISCYMFILEEKTAMYARRGDLQFPGEDAVSEEFVKISQLFSDSGYNHYEISNFSKQGKESKHNNKYWKTQEYIGIGPSAYSFVDKKRFHFENDLHKFINNPQTVYDGEGGDLSEYIMLALRLKEGLKETELIKLYGKRFSDNFFNKSEELIKEGLAVIKDKVFYLTETGMLVSNSIICEMTEEDLYEDI